MTIDPFEFREEVLEERDGLRPPLTDVLVEDPEPPIPESKLSRPLQERIGRGPFKQSTPVLIRLEIDEARQESILNLQRAAGLARIRHEIPTFGLYAATLPNEFILAVEDDPGVRRAFFDNEVAFPGPKAEFVRARDFQPEGVKLGTNLQTIRSQVSELLPAAAGAVSLGSAGTRPLSTTSDPSWTPTAATRALLGAAEAKSDGIDGSGITVAVLDTGVPLGRIAHPQLGGSNIQSTSFIRTPLPERSGHGSHVSSIIAGAPYKAPNGLSLLGMAPGVNILSIKVLETPLGIGRDSDIIKGMEMALDANVDILNMSLGSEGYDPDNAFEEPLQKLVDADIIPLAAVGNSGPGRKTVGTPAGSQHCIAVGSINSKTGTVAGFSSRGPTELTGQLKPDIVSFGGDNVAGQEELIYSTTAPGSTLDKLDGKVVDRLAAVQGTSQACPHHAGVVAWWAQYVKDRLGRRLTVKDVRNIYGKNGRVVNNEVGRGLAVYNWVKVLGGT